MNCDVVCLITLNEILRFALRGVVDIAFNSDVGHDLPYDCAANSARLRVPLDVISFIEHFGHGLTIIVREQCATAQDVAGVSAKRAGTRSEPKVTRGLLIGLAPCCECDAAVRRQVKLDDGGNALALPNATNRYRTSHVSETGG